MSQVLLVQMRSWSHADGKKRQQMIPPLYNVTLFIFLSAAPRIELESVCDCLYANASLCTAHSKFQPLELIQMIKMH
jgi:hypothetical protein